MDKLHELASAFAGEWVLIRITRFDQATTTPLDGEVVFHGRNPETAYARARDIEGLSTVLYVPTPQEQGAIILTHVHVAL